MSANQDVIFRSDLFRMNEVLKELDAIVHYSDGFVGIDPSKVSSTLLDAYSNLISYGYANSFI